MTGERWNRIEEIYHAALNVPVRERDIYIHEQAAGDAELAAEIETLLTYDERSAAFMEGSAIELAARILASQQSSEDGGGCSGTVGSYEIQRRLGAGGMGEVYLARDPRLARNVALKVLRPDLPSPGWVADFRQEALAVSALNHPNILTIYEIGEHDRTEFIATEYIEGITLRQRLKNGPIPAGELIGIALQIAEGLAAAHEAGVLHRDIKPDNVMLRTDGLVKILDFGIATTTRSDLPGRAATTGGDGVIGTLGYMSPEQRLGLPVDARTDLWSLGIVLYEMVTGRLPATPRADGGLRAPPLSVRPVALDGLAAVAAPGIVAIIRRALSRKIDDRYATAGEMARDLRELQRTLEESTRGAGAVRPDTVRERSRRVRPLSRIGAVGVILSAATAGLLFIAARNLDQPVINSLGVMPLENTGGVRGGEYLADGITASLRSHLSQLSSIRQAAASEASRYKRLGMSPAQAGRELGVAAIVTGTLERHADTVVVQAELLQSGTGTPLWKRRFVRPASDVRSLHTEIARDIVDALRLSRREAPALRTEEIRDPQAYQLYLKGRYHVLKRTPADLRKGIEYLRDAVTTDPAYGRAHAKLADAYILLAMTSDVPPREAFPEARLAAERALSIDSNLSDARVSMGIIKFWYDWDWSGAELEFKRALAAEHEDPAAHTFYGHLLSNLGDHTAAIEQIRRALDYEPHSAVSNALFGQFLYYQGRYDESLAQLEKTLDLDPELWLTHNMIGRLHERTGRYADALTAFHRATDLGGSTITTASAAYTYAVSGRPDEARRILDELKARSQITYVPPSNFALIHLGLGEHEKALDWLEKGYETRDMLLAFLTAEPKWAALAGHPRFAALLSRVGLKP